MTIVISHTLRTRERERERRPKVSARFPQLGSQPRTTIIRNNPFNALNETQTRFSSLASEPRRERGEKPENLSPCSSSLGEEKTAASSAADGKPTVSGKHRPRFASSYVLILFPTRSVAAVLSCAEEIPSALRAREIYCTPRGGVPERSTWSYCAPSAARAADDARDAVRRATLV